MLLFFIPVSVLWGLEPVAAAAAGFLGYTSSLAFLFVLYFVVVVSENKLSNLLLFFFLFPSLLTCSRSLFQVVVKKWSIPCPLPRNVTTLSGALQVTATTTQLHAAVILVTRQDSQHSLRYLNLCFFFVPPQRRL